MKASEWKSRKAPFNLWHTYFPIAGALIFLFWVKAIDWRAGYFWLFFLLLTVGPWVLYFLGIRPLYEFLNEPDSKMTPTKFIWPMLTAILFLQAGFALIYLVPDERTSTFLVRVSAGLGIEERVRNFLDAFYFSGVTLFTVGYGDIIPKGGFRFIAMAEFYIGMLVIITIFSFGLAIFANRIHEESKVPRRER